LILQIINCWPTFKPRLTWFIISLPMTQVDLCLTSRIDQPIER